MQAETVKEKSQRVSNKAEEKRNENSGQDSIKEIKMKETYFFLILLGTVSFHLMDYGDT